MDIHKGFGNANKIMNRLLFDGFENFGLRISEIDGGSLRNAIPRESKAIVAIDRVHETAFEFEMGSLVESIKLELKTLEPDLTVVFNKIETPKMIMDLGVQEGLTRALYAGSLRSLISLLNSRKRAIVLEKKILMMAI